MGYTLMGLKNKIEEMYPEILEHKMACTVTFDEAKNAYIVRLTKEHHELTTHVEKADADACMDGQKCVYLGVQIAQFIKNFEMRK